MRRGCIAADYTRVALGALALLLLLAAPAVRAYTHGPAFALATPTLGEGQWSSDTLAIEVADTTVLREMLGYGLTPDLQLNASVPLAWSGTPATAAAQPGIMGAYRDFEASLMWRFRRRASAVGERRESTLLIGLSVPEQARLDGIATSPGVSVAAVTGYASRSWYWWVGAGDNHHFGRKGDRIGDLPYLSAVVGWRPPAFRHGAPTADWRLFLESLALFPQRNIVAGAPDPASGGRELLVGPSVLGLYGAWGIEFGVLLPVYQQLNGKQPAEHYRAVVDFTYWF